MRTASQQVVDLFGVRAAIHWVCDTSLPERPDQNLEVFVAILDSDDGTFCQMKSQGFPPSMIAPPRVNRNVEPLPSPSLSAQRHPPRRSTVRRAIVSPAPLPPPNLSRPCKR